jgi:uncharacterized protein (DUF1684 family)
MPLEEAIMEGAKRDYAEAIDEWRLEREQALRRSDGWLSVVGLHWLTEPVTTCGSAPINDIVLVGADVPAHALFFRRDGSKIIAEAAPGVRVTSQRTAVWTTDEMRTDAGEARDILRIGTFSLELLERRARRALRVRDDLAPQRKDFPGLRWFPLQPQWVKSARFIHHEPRRTLPITDVTGDVFDMPNPGYALFDVSGVATVLEAVRPSAEKAELLFLFKDATNRDASYGGGRYLAAPFDGRLEELEGLVLDFNRAVTPPCGLTPYATCPIPPSANVLEIAVTAGELRPPSH